jgi:hypothetical protein
MINTLKRWIRKSVLKDRIAAGELERRSKFPRVRWIFLINLGGKVAISIRTHDQEKE